MFITVCVPLCDYIIRKASVFFLPRGWADVHVADKETHCEEAAA